MRFVIAFCCFVLCLSGTAAAGEIINVVTHKATHVVTDPKQGFKIYNAWGVFPPAKTEYRSAIMTVTYQCPDSQHCGEWDYVDNVTLRRTGGSAARSRDLELARLISPYGSRFAPDWKFSWQTDITDFSSLLHDSVEVEFRHSGYETDSGRGWKVTISIALLKGSPALRLVGVQKLWEGRFPYGDTLTSIEDSLRPVSVTAPAGAAIARLRILQTGHGMDTLEGCAEFCSKYRRVIFDDSLVDQRQIWRECGSNPVFPQAGTWIFNRANWCPGSMVAPDTYDLDVSRGGSHTVDVDMEPYLNRSPNPASYVFSAYLFYYSAPVRQNDATLEEIITPSTFDAYSRLNPVCANPQIRVQNNGGRTLRSVIVTYGLAGAPEQRYTWKGELPFGKSAVVTLPGLLSGADDARTFTASLRSPNGAPDEYAQDDDQISVARVAPIYDSPFVLLFRTNNDSTSTSYEIRDREGALAASRRSAGLRKQTLYRDTVSLRPGCYELAVADTGGDGLDFWYNAAGGYGYVRLTTAAGILLKAFPSDFGSMIRHSFRVGEPGEISRVMPDSTPVLNLFPIRNPGKFFIDLFLNEPSALAIQIATEDGSKVVYDKNFPGFKEGMIDVDISAEANGLYVVKATAGGRSVSKKMKLRKD